MPVLAKNKKYKNFPKKVGDTLEKVSRNA